MYRSLGVLVSLAVVLTTVSAWWKPSQHTTWQLQLLNDDGHLVKTYDVECMMWICSILPKVTYSIYNSKSRVESDISEGKSSGLRVFHDRSRYIYVAWNLRSESLIQDLRNHGRKVICYFSAGSYERWRADHGDFPDSVLGHSLAGWDERWLDIRSSAVRDIMKRRMDLAVQKGCDGVDADNVDMFTLSTSEQGFHSHIDSDDQLDYNKFLATEAHHRGLSIGLKNDVGQLSALEPYFDWALNESCMDYNECDQYEPFLRNHKAVFHVQYSTKSHGSSTRSHVCHASSSDRPPQFMTLIKERLLTDWRLSC